MEVAERINIDIPNSWIKDNPENYGVCFISGFDNTPWYLNGDVVLLDRTKKDLTDGKLRMMVIDGQIQLRRIFIDSDIIKICGIGLNVEPIEYTEEIVVLGEPVKIIRECQ